MRKTATLTFRVVLGGVALSLSACGTADEAPTLPETHVAEADAPRFSGSQPGDSTTTATRGAYVGAGY